VFLRLGLTSFGGPVAHLAAFRREFVEGRKWLDEDSWGSLAALCQFLPGPASSQAGMAVGLLRAGPWGALAAWAGFTLPSALAMALLGMGVLSGWLSDPGILTGLKTAAAGVVAHAVLSMGRGLYRGGFWLALMILSAAAVLGASLYGGGAAWAPIPVIALAGLAGWKGIAAPAVPSEAQAHIPWSKKAGLWSLALFVLLLFGLPFLAPLSPLLALAEAFYRSGSLVFGGGHVVLPLLQAESDRLGWASREAFLAGYGAVQAVPGPLFTFSSYLGSLAQGWTGAVVALAAMFLPAWLILAGALPFWDELRRSPAAQGALAGANAAVVGILLAALIHPIGTESLGSAGRLAAAAGAFALLQTAKMPVWAVVAAWAGGGWALQRLALAG
jgi:chromate transporter